jgi:hypothetical protein
MFCSPESPNVLSIFPVKTNPMINPPFGILLEGQGLPVFGRAPGDKVIEDLHQVFGCLVKRKITMFYGKIHPCYSWENKPSFYGHV